MTQPTPATGTERPTTISAHERRRIAVAAACDPGCVTRYLLGESMRSTTIDRIESAMRRFDLGSLISARASRVGR
jgi:hypothetical protein